MIVLGLILLIIGLLFGVNLLAAIGLVLILVGLILNFVPIGQPGPYRGRWW